MLNRAFLFVAFAGLAACGTSTQEQPTGGNTTGSTPTGGNGGNGGGTSTGTGAGAPAADPVSVEFPSITIQPGEENTQCVVREVPNDVALHIGEMHNVLSLGSHHLIVYRTNDTAEKLTPYKCQPFADLLSPSAGTPLMISQKHDDTLTLPKGVAFNIQAHQFIRLEMHYINTTGMPLDVTAKSTFIPMKDSDFKDEADFLFFGNPDIKIPAHSTFNLGPTYVPLPTDLADSKFFGFTGHEHHLGTSVTVNMTSAKGVPGTPVYDVPGWTWQEPATVYADPPLSVPTGGGFNLNCSWNNTTDQPVKFGESATAEMCFFWTYYYPSKGARVCAHTDQFNASGGGFDLCCPSTNAVQQGICDMVFAM